MSTVPKLEKDDVKVYLVDHDTYNAEIGNYGSIQILDTTLAQKGATCSVTNVSVEYSTKSAVIDCTLPPLGTTFAGSKTIKLADDVADKSTQRNTYDFIVSVPNYNLKFTTRYNDAQPGLAYVGLQTKDLNGKYYVTKMQEMTPGICANTTSYKKGNWGISSSGYYVDSATTSFGPDDAFYGTLNPTNNKYYKTIASNYGEPVGNKATSVDALTDDEYELLLKGTLTGKDDVVSVWNGLTAGQKWEYNLYRKHQWTLKDTRNGYDYVIRKLADDNCWMVQNLDLELTTLTTFTDADTDINTYRNPDGSEFAGVPTGAQIESGLASKSWTPSSLSDTWKSSHAITDSAEKATRGDYIITQYENKNEHDWAWDDNGEDGTHAYRQSAAGNNIEDKPKFYDPDDFKSTTPAPYIQCMDGLKLVSNCTETNVDRYTVRYPNVKLTETNGGVARGSADTRLAGMYYNWYAATAGTGTATTGSGVNVSDSICPKGWQLPSYDGNKSYVNLTRDTYGKYKIGTYVYEGDYNYNSYPAYDGLDILPLSFLRSGYYGWSNGARNNRGSYGYCWGSRAASGTNAYNLNFNLNNFNPQNNNNKGNGFSVRCVAR